ncbi:MAG TPA: translation initiation factor IF-2 [Terriglobia bacterium]|nr:translation initiation factor IF-2 [Terriglobia bacterium]
MIRINELARELEVKSKAIIDYLPEIDVMDKKSHSSALEDDLADKVRAHFHAQGEAESVEESAPSALPSKAPRAAEPPPAPAPRVVPAPAAPSAPAGHVAPSPALTVKKLLESHTELRPLTRSLAEIQAEARRAVAPPTPPPKPVPAHLPTSAVAGSAAAPRIGPVPVARGVPGLRSSIAVAGAAAGVRTREVPPIKAGAAPEVAVPGKAPEAPAKPARMRGARSPASSQPIYPGVATSKGVPRPLVPRGREPRPQHPTAARPSPAPGAAAAGGVPAARPPSARPPLAPRGAPGVMLPKPAAPVEVPITRSITISEGISIKELSEKLEVRAKDVIKRLLDMGIFATINQTLDSQTAIEIARAFGAEASVITYEEEVLHEEEETDRPEDLTERAPVVTVMGHVDHGKTSLLDAVRETSVAAREAGGITQHIGAYQVEIKGRRIVFLDTPGHEAFTLMRARGAKVTDIVVLVVAADDGVMPQTLEAISHARAAKVPIVVAINKIDKPDAMPERVKKQLADHGLMAEDWGGDTVTVEVSAKQRKNLDLLLEMILLVADLQQLKANPKRLASGTVIESRLDRGRGPVAAILVQNGTLRVGDAFIVGAIYGKVRAMFDDRAQSTADVGPSTPVEVLGLEDVPQAGDRFQVIEDTLKARQISIHRLSKLREAGLAKSARLTLEQLHEQLAAGDVKELPLIIKADVQGSVEVLSDTLNKLSTDRVKIKVIHAGVGAITETDVLLASASNAVIVGFNVRPERKATELAQLEKVDIRLHTIIYNVTDEIKKAMTGLLAVTFKETTLGRAEVRDTFRVSGVGTVAGCYVQDGKITRESRVRLVRDSVVVYEGRVRSLRRFKEDVSEVRSAMECGVALENYNDVKIGDVIEAFVKERVTEPALV